MSQAGIEVLDRTEELENREDARSPMDQLLELMVRSGASDLHIKVGSPPGLRIAGVLSPFPGLPNLTAADTDSLSRQILTTEQFDEFSLTGDLDFAYSFPGQGRFRVSAMKQRGSVGMVLRRIPFQVPDIDALGLPPVTKELALKPQGLVLVTGPAGSGKSTTLAAMLDYRNRTAAGHILTLEDPIEFVHRDKSCFVNQREIGTDTPSFRDGLRRALRQDPDVILLGEMPDLETIRLALSAAETGHLVLATMHTMGAIDTLNRIVDVFPQEQQQQARVQLGGAFQGVISQMLLPALDGGRVPAFELVTGADAMQSCIRENNLTLVRNIVATSAKHGMRLLDTSLAELVRAGLVEPEEALGHARNPDEVRRNLA